ncbi:SGNH/GDSL hydrolase family protein [Komagataeibacter sp. FNDCR2]|uniref:SGNH/GDSL hydrolase family protein n=1 Tax=Komagataeibacter sp. FNDCR2 TaxID=2878682 RepID=UPI001E505664|nr:SGNH/GDSL hydrolase family protein [Komagataeibacter sp. FNDCR2]MCE2576298.1 SGNH/GDSL hydrolase family protein [Komagataeibacter sp. FNDCR2]
MARCRQWLVNTKYHALAACALVALGPCAPLARGASCPVGMGEATVCIPAADRLSGGMDRAPGVHDDARAGYAPGNIWQVDGRVWRAVSVAAGAARWEPVATARPADALAGHAVFAGGTVRMVTGYVGPAVDVETLHAGQPVVTTIGIGADGAFDHAALRAVLAGRDAGTFATVLRVHDQSGHGHDLEATPGRHVVHIGEVQVAGNETLSWGEENGPGGFVIPASLRVPADDFFFGTVGTYASSNSGYAAYPVPVMLGSAVRGRVFKAFFGSYSLDGFAHIADATSPDRRTDMVITNSPAAFDVHATRGGYGLDCANASARLDSPIAPGQMNGGYIGFNADGGPWFSQGRNTGQWSGLVIADRAPDPAGLAAFQASAAAVGNYMPQLRATLVVIGDSRSEGFRLSDGRNWPYLMQQYGRYQSYDFAVSGATTRQMLGMVAAAEAVGQRTTGSRVAVIFGGYNDHLEFNHIPAEETVRNIASMVRRLKKAGFTVALIDETNTSGAPRAALRAAVRAGTITPDIEIDPFAPDQPLYNVENHTNWSNDDTHPSQTGHAILASMVWRQVGARLLPAR